MYVLVLHNPTLLLKEAAVILVSQRFIPTPLPFSHAGISVNLIGKLICTKRNYVLFTFCQLSFNPSFIPPGLFTAHPRNTRVFTAQRGRKSMGGMWGSRSAMQGESESPSSSKLAV